MGAASADIAIVGGGVIGLAIAVELAARGAGRIAVIDHGARGGEASRAAAGLLPVASSRARWGPVLAQESLAAYPAFLRRLAASGAPAVELKKIGLLRLAVDASESSGYVRLAAHRAATGLRAEFVDAEAVQRMVPGIATDVTGGLWCSDEAAIDRDAFLAALARAADRYGVRRLNGEEVTGFSRDGSRLGTVDVNASRVAIGVVVIAAGWWSASLLSGLGVRVPLRPARGEMLGVRAPAPVSFVLARGDAVLIPRGEETWVGATSEYNADPFPGARGKERLRAGAASILPLLARAPVGMHWAGVRPCSSIGHPIIDWVPGIDNAIVATGHHRSGFLLAPLTAAIVAALVLGDPSPVPQPSVGWRRLRRQRMSGSSALL